MRLSTATASAGKGTGFLGTCCGEGSPAAKEKDNFSNREISDLEVLGVEVVSTPRLNIDVVGAGKQRRPLKTDRDRRRLKLSVGGGTAGRAQKVWRDPVEKEKRMKGTLQRGLKKK